MRGEQKENNNAEQLPDPRAYRPDRVGQVHQLISEKPGSLFATISKSKNPWEQRVERLFVQVLSRRPTVEETKKFVTYLSSKDDPRSRLHDAIWTLMTCGEFRFNH